VVEDRGEHRGEAADERGGRLSRAARDREDRRLGGALGRRDALDVQGHGPGHGAAAVEGHLDGVAVHPGLPRARGEGGRGP